MKKASLAIEAFESPAPPQLAVLIVQHLPTQSRIPRLTPSKALAEASVLPLPRVGPLPCRQWRWLLAQRLLDRLD